MSSNDLEEITLNRSRLIRLIAIVVQPRHCFLLPNNVADHEKIGDWACEGFCAAAAEVIRNPSFEMSILQIQARRTERAEERGRIGDDLSAAWAAMATRQRVAIRLKGRVV
jgi:hypothetical protein